MLNFLTLFLAFQAAAYAQPSQEPIKLDEALVTGVVVNDTLIKYLGIPFANAPRFSLPEAINGYNGSITADKYGPSCIQQKIDIKGLPIPLPVGNQSEDCLSINVIRPVVTSSKLPVLVWFFGGGFEVGGSSMLSETADEVVLRSIDLEKPVIHVSMNYRVSAYGFLASEEVANEGIGNFGLYDQRVALHWVKRYIEAFGGDPSRITLWGESSGAISAALHMVAYGGKSEDLFHGAFMQSGAPIPVGPLQNGQKYYNFLVNETKCNNSTYNTTLECLRNVSLDDIRAAVDKTPNFLDYQALALAWPPRVDGTFIQDHPFNLIADGKIADVPSVSGTCDDEGTMFSLFGPTNISTDAKFKEYIRTIWAPGATDERLAPLWDHYPPNPLKGSPFDQINVCPWPYTYCPYFRIAAFQGDIVFQTPRRVFTQALSRKAQKAWVFLSKRFKAWNPILGSFHGSDLFLGKFSQAYVVNFANNLDPNIENGTEWPPYSTSGPDLPQILTFEDPQKVVVKSDDYRIEPIAYLSDLALDYPI